MEISRFLDFFVEVKVVPFCFFGYFSCGFKVAVTVAVFSCGCGYHCGPLVNRNPESRDY